MNKELPIVEKELICQEYRRDVISVQKLADRHNASVRTVQGFINTHPLRAEYLRIFGDNSNLDIVDKWVRQQIHHYKRINELKNKSI